MRYLRDSDIVISAIAGDLAASAELDRLVPDGIAISTVTYMEVMQGILAGADFREAEREFEAFLEAAEILPFTQPIARRCAVLRLAMAQSGKRVRPRALDLMVAATALHYAMRLVTRNVADYADVPGLTLA